MPRLRTKDNSKAKQRIPGRVLVDTNYSIGEEMHPAGGRDKTNTSPSSSEVFEFTCTVCDETYKSSVAAKTRAQDLGDERRACKGCGARGNNKVRAKPRKLSAKLYKELVPDSQKTPNSLVVTGMLEHRLWDCACGLIDGKKKFRFAASVAARTRKDSDDGPAKNDSQHCPKCSYEGPRVDADNFHVYEKYLKMLVQNESNLGYTAMVDSFPIWHRAFFQCEFGHLRYCSLEQMDRRDDCLTCFTELHKGKNLADQEFKEWHKEYVCVPKYPALTMQDVSSASRIHAVLWRCRKSKHEWLAYPFRRTRDKQGCPYCAGHRLAVGESLTEKFPLVAAEFDGGENCSKMTGLPLNPLHIHPHDLRKYWFLCSCSHLYECSVQARTTLSKGCPECFVQAQSLAREKPKLAGQWHTERNAKLFPGLTPNNVTLGSNKKVWWQCAISPEHDWQAEVKYRVKEKSGCPSCLKEQRVERTRVIASYKEAKERFDVVLNKMPASLAKALMNTVYFWKCDCGTSFKRRFADVIRRGFNCGRC